MRVILLLVLAMCGVAVDAGYAYIGTGNNGIQAYSVSKNGTLIHAHSISLSTAGFLAVHPSKKFLYATGDSAYVSFAIQSDGNLKQMNSQPSAGQWPTHVSVHPSGNFLFGANYFDGTFVSYPLGSDGQVGGLADKKLPGAALHTVPDRQEGPHAHMIVAAPNNTQIVGLDLGSDKIFVFALNAKTGALGVNSVPYGQVMSGSGSRHIAFHPTLNFAYVVGEMANLIYTFAYDPKTGSLNGIQVLSTIPETFKDFTKAAEIRVHPNGKFVYVTNRGANTVAGYSIQANGKLTFINFISTNGDSPRGMNIDPSGDNLYVANENGNNVVHYSIDKDTGILKYIDQVTTTNPMDVEFGF